MIPLEVVVEGIAKGTLAAFENVQLDTKERSGTPSDYFEQPVVWRAGS